MNELQILDERRTPLLLKIDSEFRNLIPPLTAEEYQQLEHNLVTEGCRDPLIVWNNTIIDGHNRYEICTRHKIHFGVLEHAFNNRDEAKEWIIRNQFGRRNLSLYQRSELALQLKPLIRTKAKENLKTHTKQGYQNSDKAQKVDTTKEVAKIAGVSHDTIFKVEQIKEHAAEEVKAKVKSGEMSIRQGYLTTKPKVGKPVTSKHDKLKTKERDDEKARDLKEMERLYAECKSDYVEPAETDTSLINIPEFNNVVNSFIAGMTKYSFMREIFKMLESDDKNKLITSLQNAESMINKIKNQIVQEVTQ